MSRTSLTTFAFVITAVLGCKGSSPDRASPEMCQNALDHLADVAATGDNKIPRDKYLAENQEMLKSCTAGFSKVKVECLMTMKDISSAEWARCK